MGLGLAGVIGIASTGVDPNFVSTTRGPYRIDGTSPAFRNCATASMPDFGLDFCTRVTTPATAPDAGAFEFVVNCP